MLCMVPLSRFHLPFMDVLLLHALPQRSLTPSIALPYLFPYIHLGPSTMNTAWSVCSILIYLNDDISYTSLNLNLLESSL